MKSLVEQLTKYAEYHRDRRNIATHFVGVPMIVTGVEALVSRPSFTLASLPLSPAVFLSLAVLAYYFVLDRRYGVAMTFFLGACFSVAQVMAAQSTGMWLALALGSFGVGWVIQFVGHYYEGKKPAFVDDLIGLLIGPLFVVAEWGFLLGLRDDLRLQIEEVAGPTRIVRAPSAGDAIGGEDGPKSARV